MRLLALVALLFACRDSVQSEQAALRILCDVESTTPNIPNDFVAAGQVLRDEAMKRATHPRAREFLMAPSSVVRIQHLVTWRAAAAIECAALTSPLTIDLPGSYAGDKADTLTSHSVRVSMAGIGVGTAYVLPLHGGVAAEEHITEHYRLPALERAVTKTADGPHVVAADRHVPVGTLFRVLFSLRLVRRIPFLLLARDGERTVAVPLALRAVVPPPGSLGLFIQVWGDDIALWSTSGQAGMLNAPVFKAKRSLEAYRSLTTKLEDIFEGRGETQPDDLGVDLSLGPSVPVEDLVAAIDALRAVRRVRLEAYLVEGFDD